MSLRYEYFLDKLTKKYDQVPSTLARAGLSFNSYYTALPPHTFDCLWVALVESEGFNSALPHIHTSVETYVMRNSQSKEPQELRAQVRHIIQVIAPYVLSYKSHTFSTQEIVGRAKELKKCWKLQPHICANLIAFIECNDQKENNDPESKKLKIINDFLLIFDTNESKLTYKSYGLQLLSQSVGEAVFDLKKYQLRYEDVYKKLCISNREKIIHFFSKIKKKEQTCVAILSAIVAPQHNLTTNNKLMNICLLFLFTEYWDRFKESDSRLKEPAVIEILAKAFERLLYLAYDYDQSITRIFLQFLYSSKFMLYDEVKQAIVYHLIALFKLHRYTQKTSIAKLIENIWAEKLKGVRISDLYIEQSPSFLIKSQKGDDEKTLEQVETRSVNSKTSQGFSLRSKGTSKIKSNRVTRNSNLQRRVRTIEDQLRRCNFQRVYLLVQSLKRYYLSQYEDRRLEESSKNVVLGLIILLIKKIESKIQCRYNCTLLKKCIYLETMELKEKCFDASFQFNEKNEMLGLFECCYLERGEINFENFIKFHEKNNYQENLETLYNLKALCDELNSSSISSSSKQQSYEELLLQSQCFEGKVYLLYKNQYNEGKKMDGKRLAIISRLLLLKSRNITHNLLVNYLYYLLKQEKLHDSTKKRLDSVSKMMNDEIINPQNDQIGRLFLKMGQIFEQFQNKGNESVLKINDKSIEVRYFEFLRRKEHTPFYYPYSQIYLKMNYLKESLYFLELHNFTQKNASKEMVNSAIRIYERLNTPFKTYINSIIKELNIDPASYHSSSGLGKQAKKWDFQQILTCFMNKIDLQQGKLKNYESLYSNDNPRIEIWLDFYYPFLDLFIQEIHIYKEPEQINESLKKYNIFLKYIGLKIQLSKEPLMVLSYNRLNDIIASIQLLRNPQDRVHFYQQFLYILKNCNVDHLENIYLDNMLKSKSYEKMYDYLRQDLKENQPNARMPTKYLTHLVKYYFQRSEFEICLPMLKVLQERQEEVGKSAEIFHIQLECKHKIMLNFSIEEYLSLIDVCITSSREQASKEGKDQHFKYYFKMFRMLFNRYNFTNITHNEHFIQVYFSFIDHNKILTLNEEYISQTIFYLLRFMFEKFNYSAVNPQNLAERAVLEKFKGKYQHFVPFCNYLIKRISFNTAKNNVIKTILKSILTENPKECIWIISFLKNFATKSPKSARLSNEESNEIERLAEIYKEVFDILSAKKAVNIDHLNWIDGLVKLSLSDTQYKKQKLNDFKQAPIPPQLRFMFSKDFYFNRIEDVRILSNGKSAPLQITFHLVHVKEKHFRTVKVIIKGNVGTKKYRMESNTANFFEQIGIFDTDITYKIIHLSKYLVSLEHRDHCGTINTIISTNLPEVKKIEKAIMIDLQKRKQLNPSNERRLLDIYDNHCNRPDFEIRFSEIIYHKTKNIKDWWKRYNNFVRTHAQWSYLGYVVGLGDRHCDNILITEDAKLIHIDFQYALDTGLKLACPEWVPFRLTTAFVEPLGILGVFGIYFAEMLNTVKQFQEKEDNIWRALSNFIGSMDTNVCEQIIQRSKFFNLKVSSSEQGVAKLINLSKNTELLRLMFQGWRAYL